MTILNETPRFSPGTKYMPASRGKYARIHTVVDFLRTYNMAGELIKTRYVAVHELVGQRIVDHDVCETTIARGLVP